MEVKDQELLSFHLSGHVNGSVVRPVGQDCIPALFARYRDMRSLRYDFPLVLNTIGGTERAVLSLSGLVDDAIEILRDDPDRTRIARHAYELERELRTSLTNNGLPGRHGDFSVLWQAAIGRLAVSDELVKDSAKRLWPLFNVSGELADLDFSLMSRLAQHVWGQVQRAKSNAFRAKCERLLLKLQSILDAELAHSEVGRAPERLKASIGTSFADSFDFETMSRVLVRAKPGIRISDDRRNRVQHLIEVLKGQRFFPIRPDIEPYQFVFFRCSAALQAMKERKQEAQELINALAIAELEVKGVYREGEGENGIPTHDAIFGDYSSDTLEPNQLSQLPDYLLCKYTSELDADETLQIVDALSSGLPLKIVLQTDDLFEPSAIGQVSLGIERHIALASRSRHVLDTAMRLGDVFVLQASASQLFRLRQDVVRGLANNAPAFISVYSGTGGQTGSIPTYLVAAAATESRAFPTILYDPTAGLDWASRCRLDDNPQAEEAWPVRTFEYENEHHEMISEELTFTLADFLLTDNRFKEQYAILPAADPMNIIRTVPEVLQGGTQWTGTVPSITVADGAGTLHRAIVSRQILSETRRSLALWRNLQELGGIHNSHAERLVEQIKQQLAEAAAKEIVSQPAEAPAPELTTESQPAAQAEHHGDDPYIETDRCATCNECTQLNNKMFAYNADKQAYIADANAGTYRQLVEAAEVCQVSIIHPGKPRNPKEPGLEELITRAAPFN